ncbi:nitrile hydratase [Streptomyces sp. DH-12]|uniref:SH3-like domain-containing protein n=1 Tax=Streptomyces sp. DH-12 TaxID=2072509 RepID=UPI000CCE8553|nr:SH3-like domain-containing protein [Streptomyces sp. DH-12]PNV31917.1 nitrile hydratase [Streptomyces sp. DH-12]
MATKRDMIVRPAHDLGGLPAGPVVPSDHEMTPFEKSCHALLNVLSAHKLVNTEEKRRGVEDLGAEIIGELTYYERWAVSASKVLIEKGVITSEELGAKMNEIRDRLTEAAA